MRLKERIAFKAKVKVIIGVNIRVKPKNKKSPAFQRMLEL